MQTLTYTQHSCTVHEHRLNVPLDHFGTQQAAAGQQIEIFAREIIRPGGEELPYLVFLQGGPGGAGPRPGDFRSIWMGAALKDFRVVLLDQRGTGQATPLDVVTLADNPAWGNDQAMADYLGLFLQDQIVADAEAFREALGIRSWSTLGQSYGGFLTLAYLSYHADVVDACYVTGGLPGLVPIDDIYRRTYPLTALRNQVYFDRYPADEAMIRRVAAHLRDTEEFLPTGERLSMTRLRSLGQSLGTQTAFDMLHYTFEGPFVSVRGEQRLSQSFLTDVGGQLSQAARPLYAVLQEAIYGPTTPGGTRWAAERLAAEYPGFALDGDPLDEDQPWYLCGEHMYRDAFAEDPGLLPLLGATDILAERTEWPQVYDFEALANNEVPVAAAVYFEDMFVPVALSLETADRVGNVRTWVTNQFQHDGVRAGGSIVFDQLRELIRD